MEEKKPRSKLYVFEPLIHRLPEVAVPKRHVAFKERFLWTGVALVLFFIMVQIPLYGISGGGESFFGYLRYVLASHAGSIMELGIGPIVTAGIIMQLLVGGKIIKLDMSDPDDRALFTGVQKILAIVMAIFEASMLVFGGWYERGAGSLSMGTNIFLIVQLVLGAVVVIYLDELVSKYGFGSGVSLFIAGGVAGEIVWKAFTPAVSAQYAGQMIGAIPNFIRAMISGSSTGIGEAFTRSSLPNIMGVFATLIVFFIVVYAESLRVEIPLAYGQYGGMRGRYPIKFLYTSNIPVILAMTVFANVKIIASLLARAQIYILGTVGGGGVQASGLVYYLEPPSGIASVTADPLRAVIYLVILVVVCICFAWLWVQMTGMGARDVAQQLQDSGLSIPGFRRDIRVMGWVLDRYIKTVTIMSGAFVGVISSLADFMGALGSGTGILLTVGIIYGLYEEIARERVSEMFPAVRRLFGE
ncbi:MAG: preprotein translocase subunit SecY [Candidatus Hadarchaeum sp.]|jgi:preprotein translocase subunit SecY|nr:preprotein translocase subunit SecY [Candidatus Hadarchaeum sp.]